MKLMSKCHKLQFTPQPLGADSKRVNVVKCVRDLRTLTLSNTADSLLELLVSDILVTLSCLKLHPVTRATPS